MCARNLSKQGNSSRNMRMEMLPATPFLVRMGLRAYLLELDVKIQNRRTGSCVDVLMEAWNIVILTQLSQCKHL